MLHKYRTAYETWQPLYIYLDRSKSSSSDIYMPVPVFFFFGWMVFIYYELLGYQPPLNKNLFDGWGQTVTLLSAHNMAVQAKSETGSYRQSSSQA